MKQALSRRLMPGLLVMMLLLPTMGFAAGGPEDMPVPQTNPVFERMKQLEGTWQGMMVNPMTGKEEKVTVRYEVTSGGTSILERSHEGTPMEMISVYYPEGDGVGMTHYCMIGNRPKLSFKHADDQSITMAMEGLNGITSAEEPHMSGVTITFNDSNTLKQAWTCSGPDNKGKPQEMTVVLTRVATP